MVKIECGNCVTKEEEKQPFLISELTDILIGIYRQTNFFLNSKDLCSTCRLKGLKIYDFFFLKGH
jgi:hypothetical protein